MKKYSEEIKAKARKMRLGGATIIEIMEVLEVPRSTAYNWIKDLPSPKRSESSWHESLARARAARSAKARARSPIWNTSKQVLLILVKDCTSYLELLDRLGVERSGYNKKQLDKRLVEEDITLYLEKSAGEIYKKQLGMSVATASGKLRKKLLYELARRCGLLVCFRCGEFISTIEELAIDHKVPWRYSPHAKSLFFDLENVAFSHTICNQEASRDGKLVTRSSSGYKGVGYDPRNRKESLKHPWEARVYLDRGSISLGSFASAEEAAEAHDRYIEENALQRTTNKELGLL